MITILYTYLTVQGLCFLGILYILLTTKPDFKSSGKNRLSANWNEGGKILFSLSFIVSIIITVLVVKILLVGAVLNFLSK